MKMTGLTFNELSIESKKALNEYYYMQGFKSLQELGEHLKERTFTFEIIDVKEAKKRCMELSEDLWGCETFEEYHQTYLQGGDIPNHGESMYPVIEGGFDEWLDDGWHRFHSYVKYGKKEIPVLSFE